MTNTKFTTLAVVALAGAVVLLVYVLHVNSKLRDENLTLRDQPQVGQTPVRSASASTDQTSDPERKPANQPNTAAAATNVASAAPSPELLRLRGEVTVLRNQVAQIARTEQQKQMILTKMDSAKQLCTAFATYALDHEDQLPTNFNSLVPLLADTGFEPAKLTNLFEIIYQGTHDVPHPEKVILVREKEAWPAPQGGWYRTYGFADNHSELHYSPDGDFRPWEDQHRPKSAEH